MKCHCLAAKRTLLNSLCVYEVRYDSILPRKKFTAIELPFQQGTEIGTSQ